MTTLIPDKSLFRLSGTGSYSFMCALLAMIFMPLHFQYLPPVMILWGLFWFLEKKKSREPLWDLSSLPFILFLAFVFYYLWQLIGISYSSNPKMGLSNSFTRLSLLVFPLVLFSPGAMIRKKTGTLLRVFASCTLLFIIICFIYALIRSLSLREGVWIFDPHVPEFPWQSYFYGADLTFSIHPSYLAMYVLLSAFISFESGFKRGIKRSLKIIWLVTGLLLLVSLFFISSRAGILAGLLLIPAYFFLRLRKNKKRSIVLFIILLGLIISLPLLLKNQRVNYLFDQVVKNETVGENRQEPRIIIWKSAFKIIRNNLLLGVGIGDVRKELADEYNQLDEKEMVQKRLNAHNQFIEVLLETGIIGLILFLSMFIIMIYGALAQKNLLYGIFLAIILLFFLFETILYRLAGVTFFSLFSFLLLHPDLQQSDPDNI